MTNLNKFEQIAKQLQESLPQSIRNLGNNIERKIRQILTNQINKINLVNREEFDKQTKVLLNIGEKLNELELRLNNFENIVKNNPIFIDKITSSVSTSNNNKTLSNK